MMKQNTLNSTAPTSPDFMAVCRDRAAKENISFTEAAIRTEREQPALHQSYLRSNVQKRPPGCRRENPGFLAAGQLRAREKGISLANALSQIASEMPWLYEGDFPEKSATATAPEKTPAQASTYPVVDDDGDKEISESDARILRGRKRARDYRLAFERGDKRTMGNILLASAQEDKLADELAVLCG